MKTVRFALVLLSVIPFGLSGLTAYAQAPIECSLNVEYDGTTVHVSQQAATTQKALSEAIQKGCHKICGSTGNSDESVKNCIQEAEFTTVECYDKDGVLIVETRKTANAARNAMLHPVSRANADNRPSSTLLLSHWLGGERRKDKKRKPIHPLLLSDHKAKKPLLLTPTDQQPPLLSK